MNDITSIGVGVLVLLFVLFRQLQKRSVREDSRPVFLLILFVLGIYTLGSFVQAHPVNTTGVLMLLASLVAAAVFGVLRAYTVRLWRENGTLFRQGNPLTALLWLVAIGVHFGADVLIDHSGSATGLSSAAITLYIAVSFGVQWIVVRSRARAVAAVAA